MLHIARSRRLGASPNALAGSGRPVRIRLGALAGVAGPVVFTLAWVVAALLQPGRSFAAVQISGLAAEDARDPWIMISGFLILGGCAIAFGAAMSSALGGRGRAGAAPAAIQLAGVLAIAAGLLRRDHVLLTTGPESWHNHAHDVVSAAVYVLLVSSPVLLAVRLRNDPRWRVWRSGAVLPVSLLAAAIASAALLVVFYAAPHDSWDATLQRIAVSLPLAAIAAVAARMVMLAGSPGDGDAVGHAHPGRPGQPE